MLQRGLDAVGGIHSLNDAWSAVRGGDTIHLTVGHQADGGRVFEGEVDRRQDHANEDNPAGERVLDEQ